MAITVLVLIVIAAIVAAVLIILQSREATYTGMTAEQVSLSGAAASQRGLLIDPCVGHWLSVRVKTDGLIDIFWSTNGQPFIQVMSASGPLNPHELARVCTAEPNLPHGLFDDLRVM